MKVYIVKNRLGMSVSKYGTSNPFYSRKSDATNRANRLNERASNGPYTVAEGHIVWNVGGRSVGIKDMITVMDFLSQ